GIRDHAAPGPRVEPVAAPDERADRDVEVEVAVEADVADAPAVDAPPLRLELLDDLHRPHLRRAGDRAAREGTAHEIERVPVRAKAPDDGADEVMHVREALDREQLLDLHGARRACLAEVVAQ